MAPSKAVHATEPRLRDLSMSAAKTSAAAALRSKVCDGTGAGAGAGSAGGTMS